MREILYGEDLVATIPSFFIFSMPTKVLLWYNVCMKRICPNCSTVFEPKKYNLARGGGKYCTTGCYAKGPKVANRKGPESPFWKGAKAGYGSVHDWIKSQLGSATKCENPDCSYPRKTKNGILSYPKVFDWALKKGRSYTDRKKDSFIQLCRSCHQRYDYSEDKRARDDSGVYVSNSHRRESAFWDRN